MIQKAFIPYCIFILLLFMGSPAFCLPSLHDYAFNVNGSLYVKSFPTNLDASGFDPNTGLGTLIINFQSLPAGSFNFKAFFDHEIQETVNGFDNEHGGSSGAPGSGQTWEIGEPGYQTGAIYNHFLSGSLSNTNGVPSSAWDDTSMAMGWNFSLAQGEWAKITMVLTQDQSQMPSSGLYLSHTDPESNETVYFYGTLEQGGQPPPPPPPPLPQDVVAIPTMNEWGMIALVFLLSGSGIYWMRKMKKEAEGGRQ